MEIRKINYSKLGILIVSVLTIFSCTSVINSKKSKDLKDVPLIVKESLDTNQSKALFDTILIDVIDEMINLSSRLNLESQPFKLIPLDLPLKSDSIYYGSYWIGVGELNLERYKLLEQTVPLEWSKSGVSVPLGAYSLGKPVVLPENSSQSVNFMIGTKQEISRVMNQNNGEIPMQLRISSYQEKFDLPKTEKEKLYLLMNNQDRINAYKINIKFIATQIIKNRE